MKKLSVIIVSYNNLKLICDCLDSIQEYNDIKDQLEVIVVEQSPTDEVYNSLHEKYAWIKLIRNSNMGYGGGNNVGCRNAAGEVLLFLNPDTLLIEPVFSYMLEQYESNPKLGISGCRLLDGDRNYVQSFFWKDSISNIKGVVWRVLDRIDLFLPKRMFITGADIFVPKVLFEQAGMFDEQIFMYSEETDLCNRVENMGYQTCFFKEKRIIHLEGKTTEDNYVKKELQKMKSFIRVSEKQGLRREKILRKAQRAARHRSWIFYFVNRDRYHLEKELVERYRTGAL